MAAIQDADSQAKLARIDAEMNKAGVSAARHDVLEKQKLRVEQQAAEQRKKIARAQAVVQLGTAIMTILAEPSILPSPLAEIVKAAGIAAATATAYAQFRAIDSAKFARGGMVAVGPSHAQGGIQLTRGGRAVGIEIEGGEPVLTAGVSRNPYLLGMASMINQLAGGRALTVGPMRLADGGIVRNMAEVLPQVRTGGKVLPSEYLTSEQLQGAPIDYDLLTGKLADTLSERMVRAFVAGAQALPAQKVVTTELRDELRRLDQRDTETNI